ncbi:MAG: SpoIIE family protein phosphatase [Chloroflexota bacterium]
MIIRFNRRKRVLKCPGTLGVVLRSKSDARESGRGTGDAFLIDLDSRIFGVADGSERNETASKRLLVAFQQVAADNLRGLNLRPMSDGELADCLGELIQATNEMLLRFGYHDSAAFSAIIVCEGANGLRGMLFHCGDTRAYLFDERRGATQLTRTDSWLVGRIASFPQVELVDLSEGVRLLFGTDGLSHLERRSIVSLGERLVDGMSDVLANNPVEDVPEALLRRYTEGLEIGDDICLVAIDPSACSARGPVLIGGGTTGPQDRSLGWEIPGHPDEPYDILECEDGQLVDLSKW